MPIGFPFYVVDHLWRQTLYTQNCDEAQFITQTAYMSSYILAKKEEMNYALPLCIFNVMSFMSHVFAGQKSLL